MEGKFENTDEQIDDPLNIKFVSWCHKKRDNIDIGLKNKYG